MYKARILIMDLLQCWSPQVKQKTGWLADEERCWLEFFDDPSQWWDNRNKNWKNHPHFKHVKTGKGLWLNSHTCPPWVQHKLNLLKPPSCSKNARAELKAPIDKPKVSPPAAGLLGLISALKECSRTKDLAKGLEIHAQVTDTKLSSNKYVVTSLINMYAKCGDMFHARKVFDSIHQPDIVCWTALMLGYVENDESELALDLFDVLEARAGCGPDARIYVAALCACSKLGAKGGGEQRRWLVKGKAIHSWAVSSKFCDVFVENTAIDMYACCGSMEEARGVFDRMKDRDVVSWTSLLQGYVENRESQVALEMFDEMQERAETGCSPNSRTYVVALTACASLASKCGGRWLEKGIEIHREAVERGSCTSFVKNTLIDMYGKCGSMSHARSVFNGMERRDVVTWTALIMGYVENEENELALELFSAMDASGVVKDSTTYLAALMACGNLLALEVGEKLHGEVRASGKEKDVRVANCLVDFYGKCGMMEVAKVVFDGIGTKTVVSWNSLLCGYSSQGDTENVFQVVERMREHGVQPSEATFVSLLASCSHAGLTEQGKEYFTVMCSGYGLTPSLKHYNCMVDLLGRANSMEECLKVVRDMPFQPDVVTWTSILGACRKWNNVEVGRTAYEALTKLENKDAAAYVLMASLYRDGEPRTAPWSMAGVTRWTDSEGKVHKF